MIVFRRVLCALMAMVLLISAAGGCSIDKNAASPSDTLQSESVLPQQPDMPDTLDTSDDTPSVPEIQWAAYDSTQDEPFLPKNIFDNSMYVNGVVPVKSGDTYNIEIRGESDPAKAFILEGEYGKCYEIRFVTKLDGIRAARVNTDPRTLEAGSSIPYTSDESVRYYKGTPDEQGSRSFMYVCREKNEYLVVYTGTKAAGVQIDERTMLHDTDTAGPWFYPDTVGSITKTGGTFGSYQWTSDHIINNLYEPYRAKYPEYIERTHLGKDQSGTFDMYGYIYTPKNYTATLFITGGMHGNEESAYFSLAKLMQLICDAQPEDELLYTMREKVRFIVVPIINVWAVSQNHDGTSALPRSKIRYNSTGTDLNRDFGELTQQESRNVLEFFKKYYTDVDIALDFHNAKTEGICLYYNFINNSVNSVANYKTTNHMYQRLKSLGYTGVDSNIRYIPGSYTKNSVYIEGRLWNEFKVPTITVEHITNSSFPNSYTQEGMTLAVETYGNFVIQNALFFINENSK